MQKLQALVAKTFHEVRTSPDRETTARTIARSTTIIGRMLERIADQRGGWSRPAGTITRIGRVLWGLVELAAPQSFYRILGNHWIALLYALALLMIVVGYVTSTEGVVEAGLRVLAVTAVANFLVFALNRWMRNLSRRTLRLLLIGSAAAFIGLCGLMLRNDAAIHADGGVRFASLPTGRIATYDDVRRNLGFDPVAAASLPEDSPESEKLALVRANLRLNWLLIASYLTFFVAAGMLLGSFRFLAGIAFGLAGFHALATMQTLRALDTAILPNIWIAAGVFALLGVAAVVWIAGRRLLGR